MASGIRFFSGSGVLGNTVASLYANGRAEPGVEIFQILPGDTSSPNRLGFFGVGGAPSSPIFVGTYQDRTFATNHHGAALTQVINVKYTGSMAAEVSGVPLTSSGHTLETIPRESGTLVLRFKEPNNSLVQTQNGVFRALNFTAASGVPDISDRVTDVVVRASQLADTAGYSGDADWTLISSGGADLTLQDQSIQATVHDFHIIISAAPSVAGSKVNWGFFAQVEYF